MTADSNLPRIHTIRGQRVMLDRDLAQLYQIATMAFNQAIQRNRNRFPIDFAFRITREEFANLQSQDVISSPAAGSAAFRGHGGSRHLPWAFTE